MCGRRMAALPGRRGQGSKEMQESTERVDRFIEALEKLYGRKPKRDDAEGDFKIRVARDMQTSVGGARYYLRLATNDEHSKKEA